MTIMNCKDAAAALDTDTRTLRKFLRSDASPIAPVGKGGRYSITGKDMRSIKTRFKAWDDARSIKKDDDAPADA